MSAPARPTTNGTASDGPNGQPAPAPNDTSIPNGTHNTRPPHRRKISSPLAPAFMVSAPGKTIVFGEHAVVHGRAAMAASISLRSYLLVTTLTKSQRTITMSFRDISLEHTWQIDDLPWSVSNDPANKKRYYDLVTSLNPKLVEAMQPHVESVAPNAPDAHRKMLQAAASCFLYLFMSLGSPSSPGCIYTLRSTVPVGVGLGSSASISVCIATALLIQSRALSGPHPDQMSEEAEQQLERINQWAFVGEMCIHGNPSGVDNTVSTRGKAVLFKRTDYNKPPLVTSLKEFPELPLLLVDTKQTKSTAAEVAKVAALKKKHPEVSDRILDAIDAITESAHRLITAEHFTADDNDALAKLGDLINMNHGLLYSLGVSHPKLERLKVLVDESGVGWTKLTGAGGGGCAITLLKPEAKMSDVPSTVGSADTKDVAVDGDRSRAQRLEDLEARLAEEGFEKYETTLGGDGAGVLWPAVLHNGSQEEGGEEIDLEKFVAADGREGVERLVGVNHADGGVREGWKFWRL